MHENRLHAMWKAQKPTYGAWLSIPSSFSAEIAARQGFDFICIDMQHGLIDYSDCVGMLQGVSQVETATPIVRVPWNEPWLIMKVLDAGAYGVVVPMVNNRAEAEAAVAACRYPPEGIRSSGPARAALYGGANYTSEANQHMACIVMIETAEGIKNAEEIASTPGISCVYIGPSDLGFALGLGPGATGDPLHQQTSKDIVAAAKKAGVPAGYHCPGSAAAVKQAFEIGCLMITAAADTGALTRGLNDSLTQAKAITGQS